MLNWTMHIHRRMHQPSVENEFSMHMIAFGNTNGQLTYVVLGRGYMQEDTLTNHTISVITGIETHF